jgi:hypothetical protein
MKNAPPVTTSTASPTKRPISTSTTAPATERAPLDDGDLAADLAAVVARHQPPPPPGLHLTPVEVDQIAQALGLGARPTGPSILAAIDRLAAIRIGDIRLPFTPGQLDELRHRAMKRGRTVEAEMRAVVARIEDELFYQGG